MKRSRLFGAKKQSKAKPAKAASPWDRERIFQLLLEGGRIAADCRHGMKVELKEDKSVVTKADRDIEQLFIRALERPKEGVFIIGEETVNKKGERYIGQALKGVTYIVDPIDGTVPYSHQLPYWGITVARMEGGRLTDGAIYLPEVRHGELLISEGQRVFEGIRHLGSWNWRVLPNRTSGDGTKGVVAVSQDLVKKSRTRIANPVHALGSAVVPLMGVLQGRFVAYVGNLRLWDVAGSLPLFGCCGISVFHLRGSRLKLLGLEVDSKHYEMDRKKRSRWAVKRGILVCPKSLEERFRNAFD